MTKEVDVLFKLIRLSLGKERDSSLPNDVNWEEVYDMSLKQGVGAIACDGILASKECCIDEDLRFKWMGQSMVIEQKYLHHKNVLAELAKMFQQQGIKMMLLKGYGLSLNYPVPEHRPSGDIDIYLFGDKSKTDEFVEKELGITVKTSYEKHSSFIYKGVTIENHGTFFDIYSHPSNEYVNDYICELIEGRTEEVTIGDSCFVIPNPTLMAIHLLRHPTDTRTSGRRNRIAVHFPPCAAFHSACGFLPLSVVSSRPRRTAGKPSLAPLWAHRPPLPGCCQWNNSAPRAGPPAS